MKTLLLSACCLMSLVTSAARPINTDRLLKRAQELGLDAQAQADLWRACEEYDAAEEKLSAMADKLLPKPKAVPVPPPKKKAPVDPTIEAIRKQVEKTRTRFEFMKRTITKWGPSTNLTARAAGASFQDKLNAARAYEKQVKEIQKAARKDGKNLAKLRKDLEKYRDKAETEGFKELCQGLLDMLPVPNEDAK